MRPVRALDHAAFSADKMGKVTLDRSDGMMVGLNCLKPGQEHAPHVHQGQDKLYHVLQGIGRFALGGETRVLGPGELVLVPGGIEHGVRNDGESDLTVLVVIAPPPAARS